MKHALLAIAVTCPLTMAVAGHVFMSTLPSPDVRLDLVTTDGHQETCSGVYIGHGTILTAKHCTGDEIKSTEVVFDQDGEDGVKIGAFLEWSSDKADIAAIHLTGKVAVNAVSLACRNPRIGEPVELVGNPLDVTFVHTHGTVGGVGRTTDDFDEVPIDVALAPGNSGGPVYDAGGHVLGVASEMKSPPFSRSGSVNFMVSGEEACAKYGRPSLWASIKSHWFGY